MDPFDARLRRGLARLEAAVPEPIGVPGRRTRPGRHIAPRAIALAAALTSAAFVSGAAVGRFATPNEVTVHEGFQNVGEPFHGLGLQCMTPPEAHAAIVGKGFIVTWQIEDRDAAGNGSTSFAATPPPVGVVEGGFVEGKLAHALVSVGSGAIPFDWCK